uniref:beta-ketoacyl-[acyl-carrier-protein] synthase III n=1 Tax=Gambierdiscus excentricus TaxID=986170 RepID=A0A1S6K813_9DINO|nr:3-ketoacyl acyl carrier protein synthase III [Gambierdiscus excentricus]
MASDLPHLPRGWGPMRGWTTVPVAPHGGVFVALGAVLLTHGVAAFLSPRGVGCSSPPLGGQRRTGLGMRSDTRTRQCSAGTGAASASLGSGLGALAAVLCAAHVAPLHRHPLRTDRRRPGKAAAPSRRDGLQLSALPPFPGISIAGTGSATPAAVVSNDDLAEVMDTSDEWIVQRTGIRRRHVMKPDESLVSLSARAARQALERAGMAAEEVDLVVLATSTPDDLFGSAAPVAAELGARKAVAFDLTAACSGFVFALVTAAQYVRSGAAKSVVVIGADCLSRWVDWSDRATCVLFGDGAGAVALRATEPEKDALIGFQLGSDGQGSRHLGLTGSCAPVPLGGKNEGGAGTFAPLTMNGKEVFRFATKCVPEVLNSLLARHDIRSDEIDWLLLHQANRRIMDSAAKRLKLPQEKIICNLDEYGNTSAASIPLALDEAVVDGKVKPGHLIACAGFGAGLSWGGLLLRL